MSPRRENQKPRIVCVCLDSAEKSLLLEGAASGALPNLARLLERGASFITQPQSGGFFVGPIWPSFYTGVGLEEHCKFAERQLQSGSYKICKSRLDQIRGEPFWILLGRQDKRSCIVDLPKTYPNQDINGVQVVGWGAHDADYFDKLRYTDARVRTVPEGFAEHLLERFPPPDFGWSDLEIGNRDAAAIKRFSGKLIKKVRVKTRLSLELFQQEPWDLFITSYGEPHSIGHHCWHLTDPSCWGYDHELRTQIGDPVAAVYQAIDQGLGELIKIAGPEVYFAVFSSLGMGPHISGEPALDNILRHLEGGLSGRSWVYTSVRQTWNKLPLAWRLRMRGLQESARNELIGNERAARRFFALHSNSDFGAIRINLCGREPSGKVQPGKQFEQVCEWLKLELLQLKNEETGEPVVDDVLRTDSLYDRRPGDSLPDLMVQWRKTHPIRLITSPSFDRLKVNSPEKRTGDHRAEGLFCIAGPGIAHSRLQRSVSVLDLAPTICSLLGDPMKAAKGTIIREALPLIG